MMTRRSKAAVASPQTKKKKDLDAQKRRVSEQGPRQPFDSATFTTRNQRRVTINAIEQTAVVGRAASKGTTASDTAHETPSKSLSIKTPSKHRLNLGSASAYYFKDVPPTPLVALSTTKKRRESEISENYHTETLNSSAIWNNAKSPGASFLTANSDESSSGCDMLNQSVLSDTTELTASNFVLVAGSRQRFQQELKRSTPRALLSLTQPRRTEEKEIQQPSRRPLGMLDGNDPYHSVLPFSTFQKPNYDRRTSSPLIFIATTSEQRAASTDHRFSSGETSQESSKHTIDPVALRNFTANLKNARLKREEDIKRRLSAASENSEKFARLSMSWGHQAAHRDSMDSALAPLTPQDSVAESSVDGATQSPAKASTPNDDILNQSTNSVASSDSFRRLFEGIMDVEDGTTQTSHGSVSTPGGTSTPQNMQTTSNEVANGALTAASMDVKKLADNFPSSASPRLARSITDDLLQESLRKDDDKAPSQDFDTSFVVANDATVNFSQTSNATNTQSDVADDASAAVLNDSFFSPPPRTSAKRRKTPESTDSPAFHTRSAARKAHLLYSTEKVPQSNTENIRASTSPTEVQHDAETTPHSGGKLPRIVESSNEGTALQEMEASVAHADKATASQEDSSETASFDHVFSMMKERRKSRSTRRYSIVVRSDQRQSIASRTAEVGDFNALVTAESTEELSVDLNNSRKRKASPGKRVSASLHSPAVDFPLPTSNDTQSRSKRRNAETSPAAQQGSGLMKPWSASSKASSTASPAEERLTPFAISLSPASMNSPALNTRSAKRLIHQFSKTTDLEPVTGGGGGGDSGLRGRNLDDITDEQPSLPTESLTTLGEHVDATRNQTGQSPGVSSLGVTSVGSNDTASLDQLAALMEAGEPRNFRRRASIIVQPITKKDPSSVKFDHVERFTQSADAVSPAFTNSPSIEAMSAQPSHTNTNRDDGVSGGAETEEINCSTSSISNLDQSTIDETQLLTESPAPPTPGTAVDEATNQPTQVPGIGSLEVASVGSNDTASLDQFAAIMEAEELRTFGRRVSLMPKQFSRESSSTVDADDVHALLASDMSSQSNYSMKQLQKRTKSPPRSLFSGVGPVPGHSVVDVSPKETQSTGHEHDDSTIGDQPYIQDVSVPSSPSARSRSSPALDMESVPTPIHSPAAYTEISGRVPKVGESLSDDRHDKDLALGFTPLVQEKLDLSGVSTKPAEEDETASLDEIALMMEDDVSTYAKSRRSADSRQSGATSTVELTAINALLGDSEDVLLNTSPKPSTLTLLSKKRVAFLPSNDEADAPFERSDSDKKQVGTNNEFQREQHRQQLQSSTATTPSPAKQRKSPLKSFLSSGTMDSPAFNTRRARRTLVPIEEILDPKQDDLSMLDETKLDQTGALTKSRETEDERASLDQVACMIDSETSDSKHQPTADFRQNEMTTTVELTAIDALLQDSGDNLLEASSREASPNPPTPASLTRNRVSFLSNDDEAGVEFEERGSEGSKQAVANSEIKMVAPVQLLRSSPGSRSASSPRKPLQSPSKMASPASMDSPAFNTRRARRSLAQAIGLASPDSCLGSTSADDMSLDSERSREGNDFVAVSLQADDVGTGNFFGKERLSPCDEQASPANGDKDAHPPLKSILNSARKIKESSRNASHTELPLKRSVVFGSPEAAEFNVTSPSFRLTPMPSKRAKALFSIPNSSTWLSSSSSDSSSSMKGSNPGDSNTVEIEMNLNDLFLADKKPSSKSVAFNTTGTGSAFADASPYQEILSQQSQDLVPFSEQDETVELENNLEGLFFIPEPTAQPAGERLSSVPPAQVGKDKISPTISVEMSDAQSIRSANFGAPRLSERESPDMIGGKKLDFQTEDPTEELDGNLSSLILKTGSRGPGEENLSLNYLSQPSDPTKRKSNYVPFRNRMSFGIGTSEDENSLDELNENTLYQGYGLGDDWRGLDFSETSAVSPSLEITSEDVTNLAGLDECERFGVTFDALLEFVRAAEELSEPLVFEALAGFTEAVCNEIEGQTPLDVDWDMHFASFAENHSDQVHAIQESLRDSGKEAVSHEFKLMASHAHLLIQSDWESWSASLGDSLTGLIEASSESLSEAAGQLREKSDRVGAAEAAISIIRARRVRRERRKIIDRHKNAASILEEETKELQSQLDFAKVGLAVAKDALERSKEILGRCVQTEPLKTELATFQSKAQSSCLRFAIQKGLHNWAPIRLEESNFSFAFIGCNPKTCVRVTFELSDTENIRYESVVDNSMLSHGEKVRQVEFDRQLSAFVEHKVKFILKNQGFGVVDSPSRIGPVIQQLERSLSRVELAAQELFVLRQRPGVQLSLERKDEGLVSVSFYVSSSNRSQRVHATFALDDSYPFCPPDALSLDATRGGKGSMTTLGDVLRRNVKPGFDILSRHCQEISAFLK